MRYNYQSEEPIKRRKLSLTKGQLHELKCYFVNDYVNDLSVNELKDIVYENMLDNLEEYSQKDVINEVKSTFDKAYLRQLINQVMNNKAPPIILVISFNKIRFTNKIFNFIIFNYFIFIFKFFFNS